MSVQAKQAASAARINDMMTQQVSGQVFSIQQQANSVIEYNGIALPSEEQAK
jgi:hypothetical protein